MNNINTIAELLDFFKIILSTNNNTTITEDMIYDILIKMNIPENEYEVDISSLFEEWATKFSYLNKKITDNYIELSNYEIKIPNPLKLYIPMDYNHIYKNVNKIIGYLDKDKTPFQLRISKFIRNDNVIIRLDNVDTLIDLEKFISENVTEGLFNPNPFAFNYENVGIAIDGTLSFNSVVANLLYQYLLSKQEQYNTIQTDDFYNYIIDLYTNTFIELNTYSNMNIPNIYNFLFNEKSIVYYKYILEYLLKSSEKSFDIKHLKKFFDESNNIEKLANEKRKYNVYNSILLLKVVYSDKIPELIDRIYKYIETGNKSYITNNGSLRNNLYLNSFRENLNYIITEDKTSISELFNKLKVNNLNFNVNTIDTSKNLKNIIKELAEIYDYKTAIEILQIYIHTNDLSIFTRDNDLRNKVLKNNLRNNILSILIDKNISFTYYCETLDDYIIEEKKEDKIEENDNLKSDEDYDLDTRFDITSIMVSAIKDLDSTNDNKDSIILPEEEIIPPVIEENKISVDELFEEINVEDKTTSIDKTSIEKLFDKMNNNEKVDLLNNSIIETYNKYQKLYEEGKIKFDGFALNNYAITSILEKDDYTSFTRLNEARKNISLLSKQDILDIMCTELNRDTILLEDTDHDILQEIIRKYIDYVLGLNN